MTEHHIPTEEQLDSLLARQPQFDLDAVKRRTLSRVGAVPERPRRLRAPFRGLLIAAMICLLSISAVAAADYATEGRISSALGIRREPAAETVVEPEPVAEPEPPVPEPPPVQIAEPEPEPVEPPELDEQIAAALQVDTAQAQRLRPAVQAVEQTAEDQDIRMTVLQTLGDPSCLYVKLRFDFPEGSPLAAAGAVKKEDLARQFERVDLSFEDMYSYTYSWHLLESNGTSATYLLKISNTSHSLSGQTVTITFENYGSPHMYTEDEVLHLAGDAGKPFTTIIHPDGTLLWDAGEEDLAAVSGEVTAVPVSVPDGFTVTRRADGNIVVSYDGLHGNQIADVYWVPRFDTVIEGKWEQSWTLSYQDTSLYWTGEVSIFSPSLTVTRVRISPLSWDLELTARELTGDALGSGLLFNEKFTMRLCRKDGSFTDLSIDECGSSGKHREDGLYTITDMNFHSRFDQPVDLTDVTAVIIDGVEFPLG